MFVVGGVYSTCKCVNEIHRPVDLRPPIALMLQRFEAGGKCRALLTSAMSSESLSNYQTLRSRSVHV